MGKIINGCPVSPAKQVLLTQLGSPWTMQRIDFEPCVYRDLGLYDIEISGGRTKRENINIFVWEKSPYFTVIEKHLELHYDEDDIKAICEDIVDRLGVESDETYTDIVRDGFSRMELTRELLQRIKECSHQCYKAEYQVNAHIRCCMVDAGIKLYKGWQYDTDDPESDIVLQTKSYRHEHPEAYVDTEEWKVFQKREEELKGLINSLSVRKTDDLLCVIRLGKYLENHWKSIECARAFRDSIGAGGHPDNDVALECRRVIADPYREKLSKYISVASFLAVSI